MKKAKAIFSCVVFNRAGNGRWSKTREIKTQRAAENLWQRMTKNAPGLSADDLS